MLALSNPITTFLMYFTLLISLMIFGKAFPFNSENKEGRMSVIGLNLLNSTKSFSKSL